MTPRSNTGIGAVLGVTTLPLLSFPSGREAIETMRYCFPNLCKEGELTAQKVDCCGCKTVPPRPPVD